ncbi:MAG TPA: SCO family protein [Ilumatobacteraceae bacterium]|nr:SCO family protein [Ilumatobacteraceae bacterium]
MRIVRNLLLVLAPLALITACGDDRAAKDSSAPSGTALIGYALKPPANTADLALPEAGSGEPVTLKAKPGGLMVVYFGYTNCPDVCPTSMAAAKAALRMVGAEKAAKVDGVMITVDPDRDTAAILPGYVESFVPTWRALRTEDADLLATAAKRFGVSYSVKTAADGSIEVSHTGTMFIVDETGDVVDAMLFGVTPADIANDFVYLLKREQT